MSPVVDILSRKRERAEVIYQLVLQKTKEYDMNSKDHQQNMSIIDRATGEDCDDGRLDAADDALDVLGDREARGVAGLGDDRVRGLHDGRGVVTGERGDAAV